MKKQRKKPQSKRAPKQADPAVEAETARSESRRKFLRLARNTAIALPVLVGATVFSVQSVQATICEADLTKIGKGKPSVVQVHDPNCSLCQQLQRQTRKALKSFDDEAVTFLVADINTAEGGAFAARFGVPHVTLLLFDGDGEMVQIVRGPSDTDSLREIIGAHLAAYG
ncbi:MULTISPECIES: thioredoxin family protein [unclassified Roseovarius]|uniref:thioredoxin family protein n=1 Tax=unclassified Roseovarius TaxID=2614913 RepID=UPI00273FBDAF|nr:MULTISPECIES: thioredoxin family protein [unclassified Roseovarius]